MVKDRSSEFRRKAEQHASGGLDVLENGSVTEPNSSFFFEVEDSRKLIESITQDIIKLRSKQNMILAEPIVEIADKEQLDEYITAIRHRIGILKPRLLKMKNDIADATRNGIRGADLRIRKYHVEALIKKLADALEMLSNAELNYRRRVASRIKRQLDLAGEYLSESEIDAMIDSKSTQIFHRKASTGLMRSVLEDATSRHNEILKLEHSINELNEMYSDLSILVHSQGEMIDRIDTNVDDTTYIIEEGNKLTRMAAQYHKGAVSKKIYCGVLCVIVILIIAIIIVILTAILGGKN